MTLTPLIPGSLAQEFGLTMPSMISRRAFSALATMAGGFVCKATLAGAVVSWPQDADGDIFRRLQKSGFDFSKTYLVDFNIEFETWPPSKEVVAMVKSKYGEIELGPPESGELGYIVFQLKSKLSYEWVLQVQREATALTSRFGGKCESWGVLVP